MAGWEKVASEWYPTVLSCGIEESKCHTVSIYPPKYHLQRCEQGCILEGVAHIRRCQFCQCSRPLSFVCGHLSHECTDQSTLVQTHFRTVTTNRCTLATQSISHQCSHTRSHQCCSLLRAHPAGLHCISHSRDCRSECRYRANYYLPDVLQGDRCGFLGSQCLFYHHHQHFCKFTTTGSILHTTLHGNI